MKNIKGHIPEFTYIVVFGLLFVYCAYWFFVHPSTLPLLGLVSCAGLVMVAMVAWCETEKKIQIEAAIDQLTECVFNQRARVELIEATIAILKERNEQCKCADKTDENSILNKLDECNKDDMQKAICRPRSTKRKCKVDPGQSDPPTVSGEK